jgi:type II secretory pathway predicted ATPase ExeA
MKTPTTKPYQDSLMQTLRDRIQASAYLQAALEDATTEPELLQAVLQDIHTALATTPQNITPIAAQPLHQAFSALVEWLDDLGLQLSIAPK